MAREVKGDLVHEINTLEELRELGSSFQSVEFLLLSLIGEVLDCRTEEIVEIRALKKGMTNRSFQFTCRRRQHRPHPGEGTGKMINRKQEYDVYQALKGKEIADPVRDTSPKRI